MIREKKTALVIGAGPAKCAAVLGLWSVLEQENIHFDMIVGGSLYAAAMALGFPLQEAIEKTKTLWTKAITEKRNWRGLLSAALPRVFGFNERFSMIDDRPIYDLNHTSFRCKTRISLFFNFELISSHASI